jgi:HSP20 family molecular chaperone IbpA
MAEEHEKIRTSPDVCSYVNRENNRLHLEISLPGVKKENIQLKMKDDSFYLTAPRDDIEFVTLLKIEVPFKDAMEGAVDVRVN